MKQFFNMFRTADGKNYALTFALVSTLFLLWGFCNGMIDVLNKHFQNSLDISKTQSALVQFANYMGYFLMAIPSGLLARRFGYKCGIIIGLILIATGAFWFIPATRIGTYWAFLTGLFILATGLTCLETVANPYTTVLGPPEAGTSRINLAQSCNGIGWMLGPMVAGFFILSATGEVNRSNEDLYKPYLLVAVVVTILAVIFVFAKVPDLHAEEESKAAANKQPSANGAVASGRPLFKRWHFTLAVVAQFFYVAAQTGIFSFFVNYIVSDMPNLSQRMADNLPSKIPVFSAAMLTHHDLINPIALGAKLRDDQNPKTRPVSQFIWSQFTTNSREIISYPSAQQLLGKENNTRDLRDIIAEIDTINAKRKPSSLLSELNRLLEENPALRVDDLKNGQALVGRFANPTDSLSQFIVTEKLAKETRALLQQYAQTKVLTGTLLESLVGDLNALLRKDCLYTPERFAQVKLSDHLQSRVKSAPQGPALHLLNRLLLEAAYPAEIAQLPSFYDPQRFAGISLPAETAKIFEAKPAGEALVRMNRRLLEATYSDKEFKRSAYLDKAEYRVAEQGVAVLLSFGGFGLFLLGRFTGSMALRFCKAHSTLALYALINTLMMVLVMLPLGWFSVAGLFLSFFFMSIMFPTIFALGIHGLGEHTKLGSSLIVMAIVGGAIMPMFMGWLADEFSMRVGFLMPLICFAVVCAYAAFWKQLEEKDAGHPVPA